jgi:ABC-2 type transport system permease protein
MTARIARHELVRLMRDGRLRICAVLLALLFLLALVTGFMRQRELTAAQSAAGTAERARWLGQPEKNPHSAAHYGVYVFKPRLAPGFLDPGIEPFSGIAVWLEAHKQNDLLFRPAEDATLAQRFGDLTVAVVLQLFAPLLVILLCFGAFAQEREQGTLRQLLSLGVPPRALVAGKLAGHLGALLLGVAPLLLGAALVFRAARGGLSGAEWSRRHQEAHRIKARTTAEDLTQNPNASFPWWKDPRIASLYGSNGVVNYAALPSGPLAQLTIGQSDLHAHVLRISTQSSDTFLHSLEPENPQRLLIGRFDAAFVVIYLLPLLLIGLGYSVLAAERETGVLAMLRAAPQPLRRLLATRLLLRAGVLLSVLNAGVLMGLRLAAPLSLAQALAPGAGWRLIGWLGVSALYAAFWTGLIAWVLTRRRSAAANALILGACWLWFTLLIPAALNLAAKILRPAPSRLELILALRAASDEATNRRSQLLGRFYEDHPELVSKTSNETNYAHLNLVTREHIEASVAPVLARHSAQLRDQRALVARWSYLSPALLVQRALNTLAGSDESRHQAFLDQVGEHHAALRRFFMARILKDNRLKARDFAQVPTFRFREPPIGAGPLTEIVIALLVLTGLLAAGAHRGGALAQEGS